MEILCDVCNNFTDQEKIMWINASDKICEACYDKLKDDLIRMAKQDHYDQLPYMEDLG